MEELFLPVLSVIFTVDDDSYLQVFSHSPINGVDNTAERSAVAARPSSCTRIVWPVEI